MLLSPGTGQAAFTFYDLRTYPAFSPIPAPSVLANPSALLPAFSPAAVTARFATLPLSRLLPFARLVDAAADLGLRSRFPGPRVLYRRKARRRDGRWERRETCPLAARDRAGA